MDVCGGVQANFKVATDVLCGLLKCVSVVGCTVCVFGYAYSFLALSLYGGTLLSSGSGNDSLTKIY